MRRRLMAAVARVRIRRSRPSPWRPCSRCAIPPTSGVCASVIRAVAREAGHLQPRTQLAARCAQARAHRGAQRAPHAADRTPAGGARHRCSSAKAIAAPVMIVKGDGTLMRAEVALEYPVETVLSGPAASVVGAGFLSGLDGFRGGRHGWYHHGRGDRARRAAGHPRGGGGHWRLAHHGGGDRRAHLRSRW